MKKYRFHSGMFKAYDTMNIDQWLNSFIQDGKNEVEIVGYTCTGNGDVRNVQEFEDYIYITIKVTELL